MILSQLCLLLTTTNIVLSVPRLYSNLHYLPAEDQVGDWDNPWSFSPTFPRVVPPSSDIMDNFGLSLSPAYRALSRHLQEEEKELKPGDFQDLNRVPRMS